MADVGSMKDWPPSFTLTPEGIAGLIALRFKLDNFSRDDQELLAEVIKSIWRTGYDAAIKGEARQ